MYALTVLFCRKMSSESSVSCSSSPPRPSPSSRGRVVSVGLLCLVNLADEPKHAALKKELSDQLDAWMKDQGDKGHETEALANTRQGKGKKKPTKKSEPNS